MTPTHVRRSHHRRALAAGIAVSAAVHAAALALVTVPGGPGAEPVSPERVVPEHDGPALTLVALTETPTPTPSESTEARASASAADAASAPSAAPSEGARTRTAPEPTGAALTPARLGALTDDVPRVALTDWHLTPLTPDPSTLGAATAADGDDHEGHDHGGGLRGFLDGIRVSVGGGSGRCPVQPGGAGLVQPRGTTLVQRPTSGLGDPFGRIR